MRIKLTLARYQWFRKLYNMRQSLSNFPITDTENTENVDYFWCYIHTYYAY